MLVFVPNELREAGPTSPHLVYLVTAPTLPHSSTWLRAAASDLNAPALHVRTVKAIIVSSCALLTDSPYPSYSHLATCGPITLPRTILYPTAPETLPALSNLPPTHRRSSLLTTVLNDLYYNAKPVDIILDIIVVAVHIVLVLIAVVALINIGPFYLCTHKHAHTHTRVYMYILTYLALVDNFHPSAGARLIPNFCLFICRNRPLPSFSGFDKKPKKWPQASCA